MADWFGQNIGKPQNGPYAVLGWETDAGIQSAALFHDFNGFNIEAHMFGRITRQTLREAFRYAFRQLGVVRVTAKPDASNLDLCNALKRIGFVSETAMSNYYGIGHDALLMRLDPSAAEKWIN